MSGWWIADYWQAGETVLLASWIFWVIVSICLHELGHGYAALWEGDDTPRRTGHMTINPMVHMGGFSILAFILIGFAWGLMPVNPANFRHRRWGDAIVALAGPAVNLVLAIVLLTLAGVVMALVGLETLSATAGERAFTFLNIGGWINLVLLALNLLPIPPLDGSRVLASVSSGYARALLHPNMQFIGLGVFILILWSPIGGFVLAFLSGIADFWSGTVVQGTILRLAGG